MIERMTEAEIAELNVRRINRDGTAEVLCTKAFYEITALRAENEKLRAALLAFAKHFGPLEDNIMLHEGVRECFRLARAALEGKP